MGETPIDATPSFWARLWAGVKVVARKMVGWLPAIMVILVGVVLVIIGVKHFQLGGLLNKLLGRDKALGTKAELASSVPSDRVDQQGNVIQPGTPDSKGITQAKVIAVEAPGVFDDPSQVKFTAPGEKEPTIVDLPEGVKAKDVDTVIVVKTEVVAVTVKDTSGITAQTVDNLLSKYNRGTKK